MQHAPRRVAPAGARAASTALASASPSWDDYRLLLAIADSGSMQAASALLGIATSTVSRRIAAWESRLGARLVDRRSDGALLTAAGRTLSVLAREMDDRVRTSEAALSASDAALSGPIRLTAGDGMGEVLLPLLAEFQRSYPHLRLELAVDARTRDLAKREADVAIRALKPRGGGLVARKLGTFSFGLYAAADYLARRGTPRAVRDLPMHDFVSLTSDQSEMRAASWLRELGAERLVLRVNSAQLLARALHSGIGIGAIAHQLAGGLTRVLPRLSTEHHAVWLVRHRDTKRLQRLNLFTDFLVERLTPLTSP